jgi:hypothetical protein
MLKQIRFSWRLAEIVLLISWGAAAVANLMHIRGGFLTNHLADLTISPWIYIMQRRQQTKPSRVPILGWLRQSPVRLGLAIYAGSTITEISQYFWPHGLFPGTFDWYDLFCYVLGMGIVVTADLLHPIPSSTKA